MTQKAPDHSDLMFAIGQMHSDIKTALRNTEDLKIETAKKLTEHNTRIASLENTRSRAWGYVSGMSAAVFALGSLIKDKMFGL